MIEDILYGLIDNHYIQIFAGVVTVASSILTIFPVPAEGSVLWYVRKGIEWLSLNILHGKTATTDGQ